MCDGVFRNFQWLIGFNVQVLILNFLVLFWVFTLLKDPHGSLSALIGRCSLDGEKITSKKCSWWGLSEDGLLYVCVFNFKIDAWGLCVSQSVSTFQLQNTERFVILKIRVRFFFVAAICVAHFQWTVPTMATKLLLKDRLFFHLFFRGWWQSLSCQQ